MTIFKIHIQVKFSRNDFRNQELFQYILLNTVKIIIFNRI